MKEPKGNNRLGSKEDGLKLDWDWYTPGKPSQVCRARIKGDRGFFSASVAQWSKSAGEGQYDKEYDASIKYVDGVLGSSEKFSTRIAAQREAERMFTEFINMMGETFAKVGI